MNPRDNERNLRQSKNHEDLTAGKGFTSMSHHNLVHKFIPMPLANENSGCKRPQWIKNGKKARDNSSMGFGKGQGQKGGLFWEHTEIKKKTTLPTLMDICHLQKC